MEITKCCHRTFLKATNLPKKIDKLILTAEKSEDYDLDIISIKKFVRVCGKCKELNITNLVFNYYNFAIFSGYDFSLTMIEELKKFKIKTLKFIHCDNVPYLLKQLTDFKIWNRSLTSIMVKNRNPFDDYVEILLCDWVESNHRLLNVTYIPRFLNCKGNHIPVERAKLLIENFTTRNRANDNACELGCLTLFMIWKLRRVESGLGTTFEKNLILKILSILRNDFYLKFE
jgi:hypothetical protein